jgi:glycyl-tRNA synthetase
LKDNKTLSEHQKTELKSLMTLAGGMDQGELQETFNRYGVTNAENGNVLSEVKPFNLMFQAQMGPLGDNPVFLRPETAQGIFVNFPRLLRCNNDKLPFGAATIGTSYRNEIAPRKKLIRTREFEMAEIEYFYDPQNVKHLRIAEVENVSVPFLTADDQVAGKQEGTFCTIKAALETGLLSNENLAYFIARTWLFYKEVGLNMSGVRFRQHLRKEMAHYAKDCWDGEILTSYGWIEVNGLADRSAFDLTCHAEGTKKPMVAPRILEKPRKEQHCIVDLDKGKIGKHFQKLAKNVTLHFDEMDMPRKFALRDLIQSGESYKFTGSCGNDFELDKSMFKGNFWFFLKKIGFKEKEVNINEEKFVPWVIEPSFGLGRIIFALLEHSFQSRAGRDILVLPTNMAPVKVSLLPLFTKPEFMQHLPGLEKSLKAVGLSVKVDRSGVAIGRKYARNDEIGVPYAVTIDHITNEDQTVTLREIQTCKQVRMPMNKVPEVLFGLNAFTLQWTDILATYPEVEEKKEEKK